jgi:photosystem II stability/assembly factor-like uncharacterized protein
MSSSVTRIRRLSSIRDHRRNPGIDLNAHIANFTIHNLAAALDSAEHPRLFAGTDQGLLVTHDYGKTWENALSALGNLDPFVVTAVTAARYEEERLVLAGVSGGLLRSADGGNSWNFIALASPAPLVTALAQDENQTLYAGTAQDGVFHSNDRGKTWARWNFGLLDWHIFSLCAASWQSGLQSVLAGTETGVFFSANQGRTWRESDFPIDAGAVLAIDGSSGSAGDVVFAATELGQVYCSRDQGVTWRRCADDVFHAEIISILSFGERGLALSGGELFQTRDGGLHWANWQPDPPLSSPVLALTPSARQDPVGLHLFAALADGNIRFMDYR